MLDSGLGPTGINTILSEINIPTVSSSLLKRNERKVGEVAITLADASCVKAIEEEIQLTKKHDSAR